MRMIVLALTFICILNSCASAPAKKAAPKAPPAAEQELRAAQQLVSAGERKKAAVRLKKILQNYSDSDVADDARHMLGTLYFQGQQFSEAYEQFVAILKSPLASPLEASSTALAARSLVHLHKPAEAQALLSSSRMQNVPESAVLEVAAARVDVARATGKTTDLLNGLVVLAERHPETGARDKYRRQAEEALEGVTDEPSLRDIADGRQFSFLQPAAKFRYAQILLEKREFSSARSYLNDVTRSAPGTPSAERAQQLLLQLDARSRVDSRTVGVVLPLSGKQQALGFRTLRGIQLGLGIFGKPSGFKLAVIDNESNPDTARRAIDRLIVEDNVVAIIGGLTSKTATAEATKAQEYAVPYISLSQKAGLTQMGESIFRNAVTSQMQVQYLVELAMNQLGMKRFAIMYPNDAYGIEYANFFWDEVLARGGQITGAQIYDPKEADFRAHVQRLVGTYYLEDRGDEYRYRLKAFNDKNPRRSVRSAAPTPEEILPPILDFDAIFIPDSPRAVGQIAPMLAYNNVRDVRLLGTNLWNNPGLIQRGQKFVENAVFVDGFLSSDVSFTNSDFYTSFKAVFNDDPGVFELQGYDSALLLRQALASGESSRSGVTSRLMRTQNFSGAVGPLSVSAEREIQRPLVGLIVQGGQIQSLSGRKN